MLIDLAMYSMLVPFVFAPSNHHILFSG